MALPEAGIKTAVDTSLNLVQEIPWWEQQARDIRMTIARDFREKLASGVVTKGIRSLTIMARESQRVMREAGIPEDKAVRSLPIGDIDLRGEPVADDLGLTANSEIRHQIEAFVSRELESHQDRPADSLTSYQPEAIGYYPTREAFAAFMSRFGIPYSADNTILSYGSLSGIDGLLGTIAILAKKNGVGVDMVFPAPGFSVIAAQARRRSIDVRTVLTDADTGYCITQKHLEQTLNNVSPDMTTLYLTPMANPTSSVYEVNALKETLQTFKRLRPNGIILVDLAYIEMIPEEEACAILDQFKKTDTVEQAVMITSMSKLFGEPRLRAGALHTKNAQLRKELQTHWQTVFASLSGPMELTALAKWHLVPREARIRMFDLFRSRQDALLKYFERTNARLTEDGRPPIVALSSVHRDIPLYMYAKLEPGYDFLDLFIETGIVGVPGDVFEDDPKENMMRFSMGMESFI